MNTCKDCKFFSPNYHDYEPNHGSCCSDKLLNGPESDMASDTAYGGGYEGYGDYISVGKDFGCIHFQIAKHVVGRDI